MGRKLTWVFGFGAAMLERNAQTCPTADLVDLSDKWARLALSAFLVASILGCGAGSERSFSSIDRGTTVSPETVGLQRVEVTTITTGVDLDPDGYGVLNDEWDYDVGDGETVPTVTNGTVNLYLRAGGHVLSLIGIATNCTGEDVDDRSIFVEPGAAVTKVVFRVVCRR